MATKALCLLLCFVSAQAATLSASKLSLSDHRVAEEELSLPPSYDEPTKPSLMEKTHMAEDNELDHPAVLKTSKTPAQSAHVKAKVKQVMKLIESHKAEFNDPETTEKRKEALLMETLALSRKHMGTPGFNYEMCLELWQNTDQESVKKAFYECPAFSFPEKEGVDLAQIEDSKPSPLRSAYLSEIFWNAMLKNNLDKVKSMLAEDVVMFEGSQEVATGKKQVARKAPQIGWPQEASTAPPEKWTCDGLGCIVPMDGWSDAQCPVMAKFSSAGKVSSISANLACWR